MRRVGEPWSTLWWAQRGSCCTETIHKRHSIVGNTWFYVWHSPILLISSSKFSYLWCTNRAHMSPTKRGAVCPTAKRSDEKRGRLIGEMQHLFPLVVSLYHQIALGIFLFLGEEFPRVAGECAHHYRNFCKGAL